MESRSKAAEKIMAVLLALLSLAAFAMAIYIALANANEWNASVALPAIGLVLTAFVLGIFARFKWKACFLNPADPKKTGTTSTPARVILAFFSSFALSFALLMLLLTGALPFVESKAWSSIAGFTFDYGIWISTALLFPFSYKFAESL